ncbi:MAG TPA: Ig-like domain-containing protein [Gemmatimonadales bacterium]|nr:Ig-like domain-containing protein [Gemmatimonadales bacterium]
MPNPLRHWLTPVIIGGVIASCSADLNLPTDEVPAPGGPAQLSAVSGDGQEGRVRSRLDEPLVVRVTDANSQPLAGVPVNFRFTSELSEAELDPADVTTDSDGLAAAQVRLGTDAGTHTVEARVAQDPSPELSATFDLTATAPNDKDGEKRGHEDDDDDHEDD